MSRSEQPAADRSDAEIDERYAVAYGTHPIDEPDEWGDLLSFREAVSRPG